MPVTIIHWLALTILTGNAAIKHMLHQLYVVFTVQELALDTTN
jgi:hypothetical protein